ncbi:hypothetical protein P2G88_12400 [Aliiglaciecola sp. CAU 1673]|uniref:hypothetical protein n=1 Tax=Aliiglaciecola sp. CAU 1673 TaxID=3032595 RepID=UPI0023DB5C60|nr:hypothetical protein [Aliiglaciecola sp. CAU 1673]MDF2179052.1 hypothetical protein [Aliiglaciecola sp. CAU 1673]
MKSESCPLPPIPAWLTEHQYSLELPAYLPENAMADLLKIAARAMAMTPPWYVPAIFGPTLSWLPPHRPLSEFKILNIWKLARTLQYLLAVSVPSYSHKPGPWSQTLLPGMIQELFWRPSSYYEHPDTKPIDKPFADEQWFYLNGVATNQAVAEINAALLSEMFARPITGIHNQTNGLLLDLLECAMGKSFKVDPDLNLDQTMTEPAFKAAIILLEALKDPKVSRIVWICHSQGTIITANVLRAISKALRVLEHKGIREEEKLAPLDRLALAFLKTEECGIAQAQDSEQRLVQVLGKLEIYCFANCANVMTPVTKIRQTDGAELGLPFIENFANEHDLVARLGIISPLHKPDNPLINLAGALYLQQGKSAWGHLLNEHYLYPILDFLSANNNERPNPFAPQSADIPPRPRLYSYFQGQRPAPLLSDAQWLRPVGACKPCNKA